MRCSPSIQYGDVGSIDELVKHAGNVGVEQLPAGSVAPQDGLPQPGLAGLFPLEPHPDERDDLVRPLVRHALVVAEDEDEVWPSEDVGVHCAEPLEERRPQRCQRVAQPASSIRVRRSKPLAAPAARLALLQAFAAVAVAVARLHVGLCSGKCIAIAPLRFFLLEY